MSPTKRHFIRTFKRRAHSNNQRYNGRQANDIFDFDLVHVEKTSSETNSPFPYFVILPPYYEPSLINFP